MTQTTPPDGVSTAFQFRVKADWGHFRRIDTTTVKQTYRVIPRTTVEGLIGAMLGRARDSYYDEFDPEVTALSVSVDTPLRTRQMAKLELTSTDSELTTKNGHRFYDMDKMATENRQQRLYEYLVEPVYTITVATADTTLESDLRHHLEHGESVYTLSLGTSECLASFSYIGEDTITTTEADAVDSVAPTSVAQASGEIGVERTPRHLETTSDGGRQPTEFVSYAYQHDGGQTPLNETTQVVNVNSQNILFI